MSREGGLVWSKVRSDRGGETFAGISRKFWQLETAQMWGKIDAVKGYADFPACLGRDAMRSLLEPLVRVFYLKHFWERAGLSLLDDQAVANEVYDTGINVGLEPAARFLQEAAGAVNWGTGVLAPDVDGRLGPATAAAVNALCRKRNIRDALLVDLNIRQGVWYQGIVERDQGQKANYRGWLIGRIREDLIA